MVNYSVLKNGLRIVEERTTSDLVTVGALVEFGYAHTASLDADILRQALLYEHVQRSKGSFFRINSETTCEYTWFEFVSMPSHIELALEILCGILTSRVRIDSVQRTIPHVVQTRSQYFDSAMNKVAHFARHLQFAPHSYGYVLVPSSSTEEIPALIYQRIDSQYDHYYLPNKTTLVITGNLSSRLQGRVIDRLENWAYSHGTAGAIELAISQNEGKVAVHSNCQNQVCIGITFSAPSYGADQYEAAYLLAEVLGGIAVKHTGRLHRKLIQEHRSVYDVSAEYVAFRLGGMIRILTSTDPGQYSQVIKLILEEVRKLRDFGVKEDELTQVTLRLTTNMLHRYYISRFRNRWLAEEACYTNRPLTIQERINRLTRTSSGDLKNLMRSGKKHSRTENITLIGPVLETDVQSLLNTLQ